MASQVAVINLTPSGIARPANNQPETGMPRDAFSALVDKAAQGPASRHAENGSAPGIDAGAGQYRDDNTNGADGLAAAMDGPAGPATPVTPAPLVDFIDALGALRAKLEAGELLDPESLAELEARLTELADALGLDLSSLAIPDDFAALLNGENVEPDSLTGTLLQLLAPLAQSLSGAQPTDMEALPEPVALQLKTLGDKLAAMLAALEQGAVPSGKLATLGLAPGQALDADIEAALARFSAPAVPDVPDAPELAAPALKLTEAVLSGKGADSGENAAKTAGDALKVQAPGQQANPDHQDNGSAADERRAAPRATPDNVVAAPAAVDASGAPAPSQGAGQSDAIRLDAAANPRVIQSGYQTSQQQINLPQIAFELARQASGGNTRFQIRLDPPELGRIDVRLDIDASGRVNARLTVDRAETLDLMQRDQRALERALQQAGLDGSKTNLEFSLKQNPFSGGQQGQNSADNGFSVPGLATEEAEDVPPTVNLYRGSLQASGLDITA